MRSRTQPTIVIVLSVVLTLTCASVESQEPNIDWQEGPGSFELGRGVATITLKSGYVFAGPKDTKKVMELLGNPPSGQEAGMVMPADENQNWFLIFEYNPVGYVNDDDRDAIDADAILEGIREGTEQANDVRRRKGYATLEVLGWFENPRYDQRTNNLVWALEARDEGGERFVNYNTRLLGRAGYMSVTLVTDPQTMAANKSVVNYILSGFSFDRGKRYMDFVSGDKVAGYGVAALVAGGAGAAAAKLGLFAALGKLLAKMWKLVVVGFVALGTGIKRLFSKGDTITAP